MRSKMLQRKTARFIVLFFVSYAVLYGINYSLTGLLAPRGHYIEWLHRHADYVTALRSYLLECTAAIIKAMGYIPHIEGNMLWVEGKSAIKMVYSCIGLNVLCMWWAFVMAYPLKLSRRIILFVWGTFLIMSLNVARLTILALKKGQIIIGSMHIDHHDVYNVITYGILLLWMKLVIDKASTPEDHSEPLPVHA